MPTRTPAAVAIALPRPSGRPAMLWPLMLMLAATVSAGVLLISNATKRDAGQGAVCNSNMNGTRWYLYEEDGSKTSYSRVKALSDRGMSCEFVRAFQGGIMKVHIFGVQYVNGANFEEYVFMDSDGHLILSMHCAEKNTVEKSVDRWISADDFKCRITGSDRDHRCVHDAVVTVDNTGQHKRILTLM